LLHKDVGFTLAHERRFVVDLAKTQAGQGKVELTGSAAE
jgi:hypothetical protein